MVGSFVEFTAKRAEVIIKGKSREWGQGLESASQSISCETGKPEFTLVLHG